MEKTVNRLIRTRLAFTNNNMYMGLAWEPSFAWKQSFLYKGHPIQLRPFKQN